MMGSMSSPNLFGNLVPVRGFGIVQEVPSMGDSITEGVVESYVKSKWWKCVSGR